MTGRTKEQATDVAEIPADVNKRREMLKNLTVLPVLGLTGWSAIRNAEFNGVDTTSGATIQVNKVGINELKGELPKGKLGSHEISRLILGGNILASNMHPRDLRYVNSLSKAYNTERKAFETLMLAEQAGINNINISLGTLPLINKYKKLTGSKIKVSLFASLYGSDDIILEEVKKAVDGGVDFIHTHGAQADICVRDNKIDLIGKMIDEVRRQGCVAGLAAHTIDTLIICEENGIIPDFYQKTMHHDNYWSAHPREHRKKYEFTGTIKNNFSPDHNEFHDNLWCPFPEQTIAFLNRTQVPMIGFKVLAAGAIPPKDGFKWAFENGSDFICVGMFDFQIVNDVNICIDTLNNLKNRKRGWYA
uniref:hypothetical protein n=1 Tax=uncultured Draconibacterium sp. TaxID=1573823 RepID=UPI0032174FC2